RLPEDQALPSPACTSWPRSPIGLRRGRCFLSGLLAPLPNSKKDLSLGCRQECKPEPLADPRKFQYLALPEFHEQVQLIEFQSTRLFRQGIPTCLRQIFPHTYGTPKRQAPRLHRRVSLLLQRRGRPASCNAY